MALKLVDHTLNLAEGHGNEYVMTSKKEQLLRHHQENLPTINIQDPLEAELMLLNLDEDLKSINVMIENIGPGGLRFLSNIHLDPDQDIIFSLYSEVLEDKVYLPGSIIWKEAISKDLNQYGIHFETPEQSRPFLNQLLSFGHGAALPELSLKTAKG